MYDEKSMRARFHENRGLAQAIRAESAPLRAQRDALLAEYEPKVRDIEAKLRELEVPLFDLDVEAAALTRALKGKVGVPADSVA